MKSSTKLLRITTVPISLKHLLKGQMRYMRENGFDVITASAEGAEVQEIEAYEGVRHHNFRITRNITPLHDLATLWDLCRLIRREKPDIVHTHSPKAGMFGMLAAWLCRVPVRLHTIGGLPLMEKQGLFRQFLLFSERITYALAQKVYPNSYGLYHFILKHRLLPPRKARVIHRGSTNGIDTAHFSTAATVGRTAQRKEMGIADDDVVFVFVGRLVSHKGINELAWAFEKLAAAHKDVKLILVGNRESHLDPLEPHTEDILNTHPAIIQTGYRADVRPYFAAADILAFPSYREGLPNVPMQACAMGVPVISSDIIGSNEVIVDGVNGLLVPVKDTEALKQAMERMYLDRELRNRLAAGARESIVERYDQQRLWEAILEEYKLQMDRAGIEWRGVIK